MTRKAQITVIDGGLGAPPEPDWAMLYDDDLDLVLARSTWRAAVSEMREAEILTVANGHAIRRLVEFRVIYERATREVAANGPILKRARAKVGAWSPWWSVMRQASEELRLLEADLGISPVRRAKAGKVSARRPPRGAPADEFLDEPTKGRGRS